MYYIVFLNAVAFVLIMFDTTNSILHMLMLIPSYVYGGEVWRLVSYVFIPPHTISPIFVIFVLYFYYMVGRGLEQEWGTFKFNIYYLIGYLGTTVAALLTGGIGTALYLNLSLFLAFAYIYPNFQILLFLILPIKVKYLAYFNLFFLGFTILTGSLPQKVMALVPLLTFALFFGDKISKDLKRRKQVQENRKKFFSNRTKKD